VLVILITLGPIVANLLIRGRMYRSILLHPTTLL